MNILEVYDVLSRIKGCTFASLDAETEPKKGIRKVITGRSVMMFTNKKSSGYENMVRRRLQAAGKNPNLFVVGDPPWGERVPGTPLFIHNGEYYLQTILLKEGEEVYHIGSGEKAYTAKQLNLERSSSNQGLGSAFQVTVSSFKLSNITRIRLLGEDITSD